MEVVTEEIISLEEIGPIDADKKVPKKRDKVDAVALVCIAGVPADSSEGTDVSCRMMVDLTL